MVQRLAGILRRGAGAPATLSVFRSETGAAAYRRAYERSLALWPGAVSVYQVVTRFGLTRVNAIGDRGLPALVLLPAFGFSSTQWYANVGPLSAAFCVYAPDVPDQLGLSQLNRLLERRESYALWLEDLLDGLGLTRIRLAGHSYGGWLAAGFASRNPARVRKLALIAPAATFVTLREDYYTRGLFGYLATGVVEPRTPAQHMLNWLSAQRPPTWTEIAEQFATGVEQVAPLAVGLPDLFQRQELARLKLPTLLVMGEQDGVYRRGPQEVIDAARQVLPRIHTVLIPEAGHMAPLDQPAASSIALLEFLID